MPIDPETGRYITPLEAGPKPGNLRSILKAYIHQGTIEELVGLLDRVPQTDVYARSLYLLTFSGAVDLLSGSSPLRGLDVVVMDRTNKMWEFYGTNFGQPELYLARLPFNRHLAQQLDSTALGVKFALYGTEHWVGIVHPIILLQLRLANLFYPKMQSDELEDSRQLFGYLRQHDIGSYRDYVTSVVWRYFSKPQQNLVLTRLDELKSTGVIL